MRPAKLRWALPEKRQLGAEKAKTGQEQGAARGFENDAQAVSDKRCRCRSRPNHEASQADVGHGDASTSEWNAYATAWRRRRFQPGFAKLAKAKEVAFRDPLRTLKGRAAYLSYVIFHTNKPRLKRAQTFNIHARPYSWGELETSVDGQPKPTLRS